MPISRTPGQRDASSAIAISGGETAYLNLSAVSDPAGNVVGENPLVYASPTGGITVTADTPIFAAGAAGIRNYLTGLWLKNTSATASEIVIKDGAATVLWRGHLSASMTFGEVLTFNPPLRGSAATALNVALTAITATIVSAQGYTGA